MEEQQKSWTKSLSPVRIADEANNGFVKMAQFLMRVVTWDFATHSSGHRVTSCQKGVWTQETPPVHTYRPHSVRDDLSSEPYRVAELSKQRSERMPSNRHTSRSQNRANKREPGLREIEDRIAVKFRELFHSNPLIRLSAASWIRERRYREAIPILEGVLSIEDNTEVRDEIIKTIESLM